VAMARTGQIVEARQKWQQVLQHAPDFSLATENLDDSYQPPEKQQGAWPFDFQVWLPKTVTEGLIKVVMGTRSDETLQAATERYLQNYPQVTAILPMLLDRGDPVGRAFAINTINLLATPEHYAFLREFALGQQGTDQERYTAATTAAKADLLPFGEPLRLWLQGEWREIQLVGYEFHEDSMYDHTPKVQKWLAEGNHLLRSTEDPDELRAAERLFEQARQSEPDSPDILNNLAGCYFRQGREEEAIALWTQIMEQFLDYVFARCALAQLHLKDNNLEAAQELLNPLIARRRFHYDEFAVFSRAQMTLLLAKDQVEGAENWLDIWASVDPDHPEVRDWQKRLDLRHRFDQLKLGRSR
jgi:tetratricopeptide (TPR) repeat protein